MGHWGTGALGQMKGRVGDWAGRFAHGGYTGASFYGPQRAAVRPQVEGPGESGGFLGGHGMSLTPRLRGRDV